MDTSSAERRREGLILSRMEMVRGIAAGLRGEFHLQNVCFDDLVSAGTIGLVQAVDRYAPGRAQTFDAYARVKIRGAILDALPLMIPGWTVPIEQVLEVAAKPAPPRRSIREFWKLFTPRQQAAIEIRLTDVTRAEAGRRLGCSPQAIHQLEARARWKAQQKYQRAA